MNPTKFRKVASSNKFRLEAHAGIFRLLMKGIFDPYICTAIPNREVQGFTGKSL